MDQAELREAEARCIQDEAPFCTASCPVHVDVRGMLAAAASGDFPAAAAILRKRIPFPRIISRVCDQPCRADCKRAQAGGAIRIRDIERFCTERPGAEPPALPALLPATGKRVAVLGGGLSGLTAAYELVRKGHAVVVFEAASEIGGWLRTLGESVLPRRTVLEELSIPERLGAEIRLGARPDAGMVSGFDAVYLATGAASRPPDISGLSVDKGGAVIVDPKTFFTGAERTFAGGGLVRGAARSPVLSISDGRRAAVSIDRLLQAVSLDAGREKEGAYPSRLYTSLKDVAPAPPVMPADGEAGYDAAEAAAEAARCIRCECMECVKVCEYLRHYGSYPRRYIREVYNNLSIVLGMRKANEFIDSCSLCGLCAVVCPSGLSMAEVNLQARRIMAEKGKMPPSAFAFALRDLAFSTGPDFFLARGEPGRGSSAFLFFPGCQLCASLPRHVEKAYADLRSGLAGGVALVLGCCGVPAEWAGQTALAASVADGIAAEWRRLGEPTIVAGCPTCRRTLAEKIPGAKVEHLLEVLERVGAAKGAAAGPEGRPPVAVHDACTARGEASLHESVRRILGTLGYPVEELDTSREKAECCGYGGLMYNSNRVLSNAVAKRRAGQSERDYVAYCAMCRDRLASQDKRVFHALELIYGRLEEEGTGPAWIGFSERLENRRRLRERLLREIWGEQTAGKEEGMKIRLDDGVRKTMEERFILREDIEAVVLHAEGTGEKMRDKDSGRFVASHRPGNVTYWVSYEAAGDEYVVRNVYSHRMQIVGAKP